MLKLHLPTRPALFLTFVLSLCRFINDTLYAQTPIQTIEPAYISIADGLVSPVVNDVIQDSFGLIWIGTGNGLQKYDGYRFETFKNLPGKAASLQHNNVWGPA